MDSSETKDWRDKLPSDCVRLLEYRRRVKQLYTGVPSSLPDIFEFWTSGGMEKFAQFDRDTGHLRTAKPEPEDYEEVELDQQFVQFVKKSLNALELPLDWSWLAKYCRFPAPGIVQLPSNAATMIQ